MYYLYKESNLTDSNNTAWQRAVEKSVSVNSKKRKEKSLRWSGSRVMANWGEEKGVIITEIGAKDHDSSFGWSFFISYIFHRKKRMKESK